MLLESSTALLESSIVTLESSIMLLESSIMLLESSIMFLEKIYSTDMTCLKICQETLASPENDKEFKLGITVMHLLYVKF
jgi:exonuclease VII small subunit